jgi:hypothetical protein
MSILVHTDKLTVLLRVPIKESVATERIRKYFSKSNYQELYAKTPVLLFRRFKKIKVTPSNIIKYVFVGPDYLDPNNRYSLVRLVLDPVQDYVNIKATFEEINTQFENYFSEEILQKEIESFKKAVFEDIFTPIYLEHAFRKLFYSNLKSIFIFITYWVIFLGLAVSLRDLLNADKLGTIIITIICGVIIVSLNFLFSSRRRKKIEKRLGS